MRGITLLLLSNLLLCALCEVSCGWSVKILGATFTDGREYVSVPIRVCRLIPYLDMTPIRLTLYVGVVGGVLGRHDTSLIEWEAPCFDVMMNIPNVYGVAYVVDVTGDMRGYTACSDYAQLDLSGDDVLMQDSDYLYQHMEEALLITESNS